MNERDSFLATILYGTITVMLLAIGSIWVRDMPAFLLAIAAAGGSYLTQAAETLRLAHDAQWDEHGAAISARLSDRARRAANMLWLATVGLVIAAFCRLMLAGIGS